MTIGQAFRGSGVRCSGLRIVAAAAAFFALCSCRASGPERLGDSSPPASRAPGASAIVYEDVTLQSGIRFRHNTGAAGSKYLPETMGSGCAFLDVDNDGWQDALLVDATSWPGDPVRPGASRLFRNRGGGRFEDVSSRFGMPSGLYGMGVAAGDYDNDGFIDVFLSAVGGSRLLRNDRGRRFVDATPESGILTPGWPSSAAWLDYNRDGRLDLFVCRYVKWSPAGDIFFALDGTHKTYARPDRYAGESCQLFRNDGKRFHDVSAESGVNAPNAKALGVALCDFDRDGWTDVAVSNDTVPNFLFHNQGGDTPRFKQVAVQAGMAVAEGGMAKAGMGIDAADYDNSGQDAILITNFAGEQISLYRRDASGLYMDVAARTGLGAATQLYLGFGAFFLDADLDGRLDIFIANGHIQDDVAVRSSGVTYRQPSLLFLGKPDGRFEAVPGGALTVPRVARGAACADVDNDGDPDILMNVNGGAAVLLRRSGRPMHNWLRLTLVGTAGNRSAIGATVRVRAGGSVQTRMIRSGSSYLSQSSLSQTLGLGAATRAEDIEVRWSGGTVESFGSASVNRELRLVEGRGARPSEHARGVQ